MRDIPIFTTENGVASLGLKEVPSRSVAYITIQDTLSPDVFLKECISFCAAVGANKILAKGHPILTHYPFYTAIWRMSCQLARLPETAAGLFPVTEQTLTQWREQYNQRMMDVPNSKYMTEWDAKKLLKRGDGYFVHRNGQLLGLGIAAGNTIQALAGLQPGSGQDVLIALTHALSAEEVVLEVASANERAMHLYERLGFVKTAELSKWYRVL